jgi:TolB-like protein/Tfp pilus assembly protein PilF
LASDAVRCAMQIQKESKSRNIALKIGIHEGELVFEGTDILGDGVNIASRLQEGADKGCITISGKVYSDIKNRKEIRTRFIKKKVFKNVDEPIKVYKVLCEQNEPEANIEKQKYKKSKLLYLAFTGLVVIIAAISIWQLFPMKEESQPMPAVSMDKETSIAVLPFDNLSGDPDQEMMCDGLTEEIIHYLSTSKLFDRVTSRSSIMTFKESEKTVPEIAGMLNVNFILEGSYRQFGNRLRITTKLIDASIDTHLWTEIYERPFGDIFDIQSDIAKKIASSLGGELSLGKNGMPSRKPTNNLEAYTLYLKGRFFWHQRTEEDLKMSVMYFNEALKLDSTFALAFAGLADAYFIMGYWGWYPRNEGYELSKSLAYKALSIDDQIAEAHATLGALLHYKDKNYFEAERSLKLAIKLNPSYATGHQYYAELLLVILNRKEEARKETDLALIYNPLSIVIHTISGWVFYEEKKFEEAIEEGKLIRKLDINTTLGGWFIIYSNLHLRKYEEAVQEIIHYDKLDSASIVKVYKEEGILGALRYSIDYHSSKKHPNHLHLAYLNMFLKNEEEAISCLEIAYDENNPRIYCIKSSHDFQHLRLHPRFIALLSKLEFEGGTE